MQPNATAFEVASGNSNFLLSLADSLDDLSLEQRMFIRKKILEHNEENLSVMRNSIKKKEEQCRG